MGVLLLVFLGLFYYGSTLSIHTMFLITIATIIFSAISIIETIKDHRSDDYQDDYRND
jgi:hypothetical protein